MARQATSTLLTPGEASGVQRREHPRYDSPPVAVDETRASVRNISVGGICLEALSAGEGAAPLRPGDRCTLALTDVLLHEDRELRAEVVWSRKGEVGLRWVALDDEQKLWLGKQSREWREDALLAHLTEVLAASGRGPDFASLSSESSASVAPPLRTLGEPGLWLSNRRPEAPRPESAVRNPVPPMAGSVRTRLRHAVELLPWALAAVAGGLLVGLAGYELCQAARPRVEPTVAQTRPGVPYLGTWKAGSGSGRVLAETFKSDGTWSAALSGAASPRTGHWVEEGGVVTVSYVRPDPRTGAPRLVSRPRWWFVDRANTALALVSVGPDGTVRETLALRRP